ncbi:hypothetical protein DS906_12605 [Ruegeria sp. A3M17]|nr:hypothetical protein DS906_12605 [Ruegeria sp. A3M17]
MSRTQVFSASANFRVFRRLGQRYTAAYDQKRTYPATPTPTLRRVTGLFDLFALFKSAQFSPNQLTNTGRVYHSQGSNYLKRMIP